MKTNFNKAFNIVVMNLEGGSKVTNNPDDPGGLTKYGISQRAYPNLDIVNLTQTQAQQIYLTDYWDKAYCNDLPNILDILVFDGAVNQGCATSIKLLQTAAQVITDGIIGYKTLYAINKTVDIISYYMTERLTRYELNSNFNKFGKGWKRRLFKLMEMAYKN